VGTPSAIVVAPDDNPIIAWSEAEGANTGNPSDIHVAKWTGTAWDQSYGLLSGQQGTGTNANSPRLAVATAGQFFVAWAETNQSSVSSIYVARWTGASWDLGYGGIGQPGAQQPSLRVGPTGLPLVAWPGTLNTGGLSRWTGTAWASTTFPNFGFVGLDFDSMQRPLVTGTNTSVTSPSISVSNYQASSDTLLPATPQVPTGASPAGARLAVDSQGRILLAWSDSDGSTRNVHLERFDGTSWDASFGTISAIAGANTPADNPIVIVTPDGAPIVAWQESDSVSLPSTFVWKSNH
jgi:hypothetical protein